MRSKDRLVVVPEPTDDLLIEFQIFSKTTNPYAYMDETFPNTWFFDKDNHLACAAGKFAEPSIWLKCMTNSFFNPRGYRLIGDVCFIGEEDDNLFDNSICEEYHAWKKRVAALIKDKYPNSWHRYC